MVCVLCVALLWCLWLFVFCGAFGLVCLFAFDWCVIELLVLVIVGCGWLAGLCLFNYVLLLVASWICL